MRKAPRGQIIEARRSRAIRLRTRGWTIPQISAELQVCRRTVQRDIDAVTVLSAEDAARWRIAQIGRYLRIWRRLQAGLEGLDPAGVAASARAATAALARLDKILGLEAPIVNNLAIEPESMDETELRRIVNSLPGGPHPLGPGRGIDA